jgi:hypothetical protein
MKPGTKVPAFLFPTPEVCFDVVELLCIGKVDKVWRSPDKAVYVHVKFDDGTADEYELPRAIVELPNEAAELRVAAAMHTSTPADETIRINELEPGRAADDDMPDDRPRTDNSEDAGEEAAPAVGTALRVSPIAFQLRVFHLVCRSQSHRCMDIDSG